jgi:hypothetical protein
MVNQSIEHGWLTVYPLKSNEQSRKSWLFKSGGFLNDQRRFYKTNNKNTNCV